MCRTLSGSPPPSAFHGFGAIIAEQSVRFMMFPCCGAEFLFSELLLAMVVSSASAAIQINSCNILRDFSAFQQ